MVPLRFISAQFWERELLKIVLDFDGVIVNSINEVMLTAYNQASSQLVTKTSEVPNHYVHLYLKYRYFVQPASDMVVLARWCIANVEDPRAKLDLNTYKSLLASEQAGVAERRNTFFDIRRRMQRKDIEAWRSLHTVYQPLWDKLKTLDPAQILIVTNKNADAVIDLFGHFGAELKEENLYSADQGRSKYENFLLIKERNESYAQELLFVDDSVLNLGDLRKKFTPQELGLALATWGYCGPTDAEQAIEQGFRVLDQASLVELL